MKMQKSEIFIKIYLTIINLTFTLTKYKIKIGENIYKKITINNLHLKEKEKKIGRPI